MVMAKIFQLGLAFSIATFSTALLAADSSNAAAGVTAQDQSNTARDAELTRNIRKGLMSRDLSMQAKNVTIVTVDGMVTLKGNVPTAKEKSIVGDVASGVAPNVRNDIIVKQ